MLKFMAGRKSLQPICIKIKYAIKNPSQFEQQNQSMLLPPGNNPIAVNK